MHLEGLHALLKWSWSADFGWCAAVSSSAVCTNMHRILQRRRVRKLRVVWASLALVALSLAACSALFTAWTWRETRDLSQSFKILQDRLEQVCIIPKKQFKLANHPLWIACIFAPTIIFTRLQLLQIIKCLLCNFFCGCGYGNRRGGYIEKCKSTLFPPSLPCTYSILLQRFSAWHFYCLPISAVKLCAVTAYFCAQPTSATPPCLITLVPVCAPVLSQFTGKPQLFGMWALLYPDDRPEAWGMKQTGR